MSNLILDFLILAHSNNRNLNAHIYWIQRYVGEISPMASAKSKKLSRLRLPALALALIAFHQSVLHLADKKATLSCESVDI